MNATFPTYLLVISIDLGCVQLHLDGNLNSVKDTET